MKRKVTLLRLPDETKEELRKIKELTGVPYVKTAEMAIHAYYIKESKRIKL
jgi:predicted DNA-binding protein